MKEEMAGHQPLPGAEAPGQAESRKADHIELAFRARVESGELDRRFRYEPLFAGHPESGSLPPFEFLGKTLRTPIWVSSMTGGAQWALQINTALAKACRRFGMGMGLGSCRSLLFGDEHLADFAVRDLIGDDLPLYANLGIAQLEDLLDRGALKLVEEMLGRLRADGLIVHLNPMQEWFQPEGDRIRYAPLHTLRRLLDQVSYPVIVKEVGQGMGPESLEQLLLMPLAAVDFAAAGGTNFALLENLRRSDSLQRHWEPLVRVGHDAEEMIGWTGDIVARQGGKTPCPRIIISGGVRDFLDGHYFLGRSPLPAVYGMASALLRHAREGDGPLQEYLEAQVRGLELARAFLRVKQDSTQDR